MNTKVFVLAAGKQLRFPEGHTPKQLLVINQETILGRQHRQLLSYNYVPVVITKDSDIIQVCQKIHIPKKNASVLDSLISVQDQWSDRVIYLLGDVFYSNQLFKNIMEDESDLRFWMSGSEIFALAFNKKSFDRIRAGVEQALDSNRASAKIWHLYRILNKIPVNKHKILKEQEIVVDYTFDIDSLIQYYDANNYIEILSKTIPDV